MLDRNEYSRSERRKERKANQFRLKRKTTGHCYKEDIRPKIQSGWEKTQQTRNIVAIQLVGIQPEGNFFWN